MLVERADLTSGSTFHSAGLVGQLRGSLSLTQMMMGSVDLYRSLGGEVGLETGWHEVGSLRLASSQERMEELARQAGWAKTFGLPLELISAEEAQRLFPPMSTDGVLGAAYLPTDGYIDPSQLTFALAEGARRGGAEIETNTRVTGIRVERGRVTGVETDKGAIEAEIVVNAGGMFAKELGALAGVNVPVVPMAHEYLVTKPSGLPLDMPTMRDPSLLVYFRPESGGLVMGGYERDPAPWSLDGIPADFNGTPARRGLAALRAAARERDRARARARAEMEVVRLDQRPRGVHARRRVHPRPDRRARLLGRGRVLRARPRRRRRDGAARRGVDRRGRAEPRRLGDGLPPLRYARTARREYTLARTIEVYSTYYDVKYPGHEREAGRPLRTSPTYARLQELGAAFGEKSGWERPNWFEPNAAAGDESLRPRGWAGRLWSPAIGAEHRATRETAALFDETSFAKIEVSGDGAADFLERLCDNRVARDVGAITYTLDAEHARRDRVRLHRHAARRRPLPHRHRHRLRPARPRVDPPARAGGRLGRRRGRHLALRLPRDLGTGARGRSSSRSRPPTSRTRVPLHARARDRRRPVPCLALRVTYVGELGWELYCPMEFGLRLWDAIWEAGRDHGLVAGGYKAIDSCRLEKGYRVWGADITPDDTPYEAGLGFAVKLDKGDFIGRDALLERQEPERRLACLVLDDPRAVALGSEPVRIDGATVGRVTSGGYGYTVERSIAYAYVPAANAEPGQPVEVEIFGDWIAGEVAAEPLYDPAGAGIRS